MLTSSAQSSQSVIRIALASFIGTAIEFYDFYIYAMAAALVIGQVFFPASDPAAQSLNALLTFGLAFLARPLGAVLFGHQGDRLGRKVTLAASLMLMGGATVLIGLLPGYASIGLVAPIVLCMLRFAQGVGLGGEWGGAVLFATEHAPDGKRAWFGMFPQLGPSVGFLLATLTFLGLSACLTEAQFASWGWRIPFVASALLMCVGLYVRLNVAETPAFVQLQVQGLTAANPLRVLWRGHRRAVVLGGLAMMICYHLFYTATVFCLSYGTTTLHIAKPQFLWMLCVGITGMLIATLCAAKLADRLGRKPVLLMGCLLAVLLGLALPKLLAEANPQVLTLFLFAALFLMGTCYAPMGAFLPEQFPSAVRYTGASLAYQLGGILGAALAPVVSQWLLMHGGLTWVGDYMAAVACVSAWAIVRIKQTDDFSRLHA